MRRATQHGFAQLPALKSLDVLPFFHITRCYQSSVVPSKRKTRKPSDFLPPPNPAPPANEKENAYQKHARRLVQAISTVHEQKEQKGQLWLKKALLLEHSHRKARIWNQVIGRTRAKTFPGIIQFEASPVLDLLIHYSEDTLVLYADGSHNHLDGYLGAGVAWEEQAGMQSIQYGLGRYTGNATDAEIYAISAALDLAVKRVEGQKSKRKVRDVRVLTDSQEALRDLYASQANINLSRSNNLGPTLDGTYAIQRIYEHTEQLARQGVRVHLIWIKGHGNVVGNITAHQAAFQAASVQVSASRHTLSLPKAIKDAGPDYIQEWLFNASEPWFTFGKGKCHVRLEGKYEDVARKSITPPKIVLEEPSK